MTRANAYQKERCERTIETNKNGNERLMSQANCVLNITFKSKRKLTTV